MSRDLFWDLFTLLVFASLVPAALVLARAINESREEEDS